MRALDAEEIAAIEKRLEIIEGPGKVETAKLHQLEALRDRLIADDAAFTVFCDALTSLATTQSKGSVVSRGSVIAKGRHAHHLQDISVESGARPFKK